MTSKTNEIDYAWRRAQELCDEVDLKGADAEFSHAVLVRLHRDSKANSRAEPPPGYEDRLVASLMAKADAAHLGKRVVGIPTARETSAAAWFRLASRLIPATAFSFVLVVGVALFQYFKPAAIPSDAKADLWAQAVEDASKREVSRWLASVSDGGAQLFLGSDLSVLSAEMSEVQIERMLKDNGGS
ncbi:MAG TPA: hypothetical protein VM901_08700 [Bdellovibrionota bacterium]|jgi:hypothetical protein|nr:hypothetical protein [Bdellovibrionota bacterium]